MQGRESVTSALGRVLACLGACRGQLCRSRGKPDFLPSFIRRCDMAKGHVWCQVEGGWAVTVSLTWQPDRATGCGHLIRPDSQPGVPVKGSVGVASAHGTEVGGPSQLKALGAKASFRRRKGASRKLSEPMACQPGLQTGDAPAT